MSHASGDTAHPATALGKVRLTAAESFWYVLGCIGFGAAYFAKVPAKKALSEVGLAEMTSAETFWYILMCIGFGAGYFAKLPVKKALAECSGQGSRDSRAPAGAVAPVAATPPLDRWPDGDPQAELAYRPRQPEADREAGS
jgi:hypothetical protein